MRKGEEMEGATRGEKEERAETGNVLILALALEPLCAYTRTPGGTDSPSPPERGGTARRRMGDTVPRLRARHYHRWVRAATLGFRPQCDRGTGMCMRGTEEEARPRWAAGRGKSC